MNSATKIQLDELVGKRVHFNKQNIKIEKYKEIGGSICVVTNLRTLQFFAEEIQEKFLDIISDEKEAGTFEPPTAIEKHAFVALPSENTTVKESLLDALKKVKEDPNYVNQAKSICLIANAIVDIQKTEIEMIRLQKDI
ncbi:hypothetical protein [Chryseobacterium sp. Hurlbut01]|uniref:hypothetical protein n=1 Tax=Chryseobacterium sp. Hurlbut01 TaxID=1681828 RepID=UPI00067D0537|nr:hypothetical protein [Chryseobacterium sp. Hurlbut01]KNB61004.1 hypothetical protein AC804_17835 [Chryseobacterium sp. Hurlbut01]